MSGDERRYATPGAARRAVSDKLKAEASTSAWRLADLQRQYAYDQFVERLYRVDDRWVIKGATALLARRISARHTLDIDIYRPGHIHDVEQRMRAAAALDIGDWMRFDIGQTVNIQAHGADGLRAKVSSFIGTALWAAFQIDMVADGMLMTGTPDAVCSLTQVDATTRERTNWRAYPLVDHVADKVCAI